MNIKEVIRKLTIEEKISLLEGEGSWHTKSISRLKVPSIMMTDGPHGIRKELSTIEKNILQSSEKSTLFPTESTLGCTFNKELAFEMGKLIGLQARNKGVGIVLGPGLNIKRHPSCGRNFEYISEDPLLTGIIGQNIIKGIESNNVGACCKHYACNSQEKYRHTINSIVDERALREIYTKAFKMAVDEKVTAIMGSYNLVNNFYACDNNYLMNDLLRKEYGFDGLIITDWGACNDKSNQIRATVDLEMPSSNGYNNEKVIKDYRCGKISNDELDACVERVLKVVDKFKDNDILPCDYEICHEKAKEIAKEGIVLLKNENDLLPLRNDDRIAFIGSFAKTPRIQGGGSSFINPYRVDNMYDNFKNYAQNIIYADGFDLNNDDYNQEMSLEAINAAKNSHKVVMLLGLTNQYEAEGYDRKTLDLPQNQLKLLDDVYKVNKNIIVVVFAGGVVNFSFSEKVKGLFHANLGGESSSLALLDTLFGLSNPSGRLSETYATCIDDYITNRNFNTTNNCVQYQESIFVGYRYFNTFEKKVLFPFGFGLSYTTFEYSQFAINQSYINKNKKIKVSVTVKNTGKVFGKEVVMLFIQNNDNSSVYKSKKELKKFEKIGLNPKESKTVFFELDYEDFSYYDIYMKKYNVDAGLYKIQICKNVDEVIFEETVQRKDNEVDFVKHPQSAYNRKDKLVIKDDDFQKIIDFPLPKKHVSKKRPYTMNSTLEDINHTIIGHKIVKTVQKIAKSFISDNSNQWEIENVINNILYIPLKNLVIFSSNMLSFIEVEGYLDLINKKYIRGIKKIVKGKKMRK